MAKPKLKLYPDVMECRKCGTHLTGTNYFDDIDYDGMIHIECNEKTARICRKCRMGDPEYNKLKLQHRLQMKMKM